jgi:predicted RNase H-like nuclease (RuvC/YqgF family)
MANKQNKAVPQLGSDQDVDRIRDIIFGPQIRDYEQRFQNVQRDLERLQQDFDRLNDQLTDQNSEQNKKTQTLRREMRQADDDLRSEIRDTSKKLTNDKVDRMTLGELFVELGTHLKEGGSLVDLLKGLETESTAE